MEKATKGLILEFVKRLNQNTELGKLEENLFDNINAIIENAEDENIKKLALDLEDKLIACLDLAKYQYFDYGAITYNIESEVNINWEPKGLLPLIKNYA